MLIKQETNMTPAEHIAAENSNNQFLQELAYAAQTFPGELKKGTKIIFLGGDASSATEVVLVAKDYIVEQGTSGIWTYRKWASGIAECWGVMHSSETPEWDVMSVYANVNLPFEFIENPTISCSGGQFSTHASYVTMTVGTPTLVSSYIKCAREPDEEYYCWFNFDVKGRWK